MEPVSDLQAYAEAVSGCTRCRLAQGRTQVVFGSGDPHADLLFVAIVQRSLELAQTSYRVGKQDLRSVEQQQISLYATRVNLLRVRGEQLSQRVALHLSLGGSFGERTTVSEAPP